MRSAAFWVWLGAGALAGCSAGGSDPEDTTGSVIGNGGSAGSSLGGSAGSGQGGSAGSPAAGGSGGSAGSGGPGGSAGSGGTAGGGGTGGSAGSGGSGTGGAGGTSGEGVGCAGADIVCDDFEDASISSSFRATAQALPALSSLRAHSGTQSVLFAPEGQIGRFLTTTAPFPAGGRLFMRVFMNFELATVDMSGHTGFLVGATADSNGQELRLGQSQPGCNAVDQLLDLNHVPSDKTMCSSGLVSGGNPGDFMNAGETLDANTWYCVETFWDAAVGEFRIWIDDRELTVLHATAQSWCPPNQQNCTAPAPWPIPFTQVKFGTQIYNGTVGNIWYDDVAYSTARVGCQ
jgi:polysaccharide lyase-like protein